MIAASLAAGLCGSGLRYVRLQTYTFRATISSATDGATTNPSERLSLWIDNVAVISQWQSLGSVQPWGTFSLQFPNGGGGPSATANVPFQFELHYQDSGVGDRRCKLEWETDEHTRSEPLAPIPGERFFYPVDLDASPYAVTVRPGIVHADQTSFYGSYSGLLPAVQAGAVAKYNTTFILRDKYGNAKQVPTVQQP